MNDYRSARRVMMVEVSRGIVRGSEVKLDGWCEGGLGQQSDGGGYTTIQKK